ncbi:hypothetical protein MVES1_003309 [Malassezia vespertilionis]|uniref:uncharacterized protein n=1 Tax=Malassezia vespertilionis TaxID=2020962 RepID=UPI0024B166B7|nr:uncharacterized protein MVES1_003309 [Malassezia vespertilionis]WFD07940.1 hypothetical protein MVES1_003309 [Malassezia vespertilionis]
MAAVNPVLALVSRADALANGAFGARLMPGFQHVYQQMLPVVDAVAQLHPDDEQCEPYVRIIRDGLMAMEQHTEEMVNMLYNVDVLTAPSATQSVAGFNPQEALAHISDLFHVRTPTYLRQSYQAELLVKRESFADYTCEEISPAQFAQQWRTLNEVDHGRKQEMDDLADLLANFG